MPTPLQILTDPISLVVFAVFGGLLAYEASFPARTLPSVPGWRLRAVASFVAYFFLSSYLPLFWDEALAAYRLIDLRGWGTAGGAAAALLVYESLLYAWHRTLHRVPALWRSFHQMHHSAERIEAVGAFFFHPLDMVGWTAVGSLAMVVVLGVAPQAATVVLLVTTFLGIFQHANIRTPRWLGYFVQRPESHAIHHARGHHRSNYSDLPVFDLAFGTFENPESYDRLAGFYDGASARVVDMLLCRDISEASDALTGRPSSTLPSTPAVALDESR